MAENFGKEYRMDQNFKNASGVFVGGVVARMPTTPRIVVMEINDYSSWARDLKGVERLEWLPIVRKVAEGGDLIRLLQKEVEMIRRAVDECGLFDPYVGAQIGESFIPYEKGVDDEVES